MMMTFQYARIHQDDRGKFGLNAMEEFHDDGVMNDVVNPRSWVMVLDLIDSILFNAFVILYFQYSIFGGIEF